MDSLASKILMTLSKLWKKWMVSLSNVIVDCEGKGHASIFYMWVKLANFTGYSMGIRTWRVCWVLSKFFSFECLFEWAIFPVQIWGILWCCLVISLASTFQNEILFLKERLFFICWENPRWSVNLLFPDLPRVLWWIKIWYLTVDIPYCLEWVVNNWGDWEHIYFPTLP